MHLHTMSIGDSIKVQGPNGRFHYLGNGEVMVKVPAEKDRRNKYTRINMVAGGSGLTPMY